jgi:hypothetical protein
MNKYCRVLLLVSTLLFIAVGMASADTLSYNFSGAVSASFELPVNPIPTVVDPGFGFQVTPINLIINGVTSNDFLVFYNADPVTGGGGVLGAFSCGTCVDFSFTGPQLYSGPESSPTMLSLAGITLNDGVTGDPVGTISTTPEPAALVLLTVGILSLALAVVGNRRNFALVSN